MSGSPDGEVTPPYPRIPLLGGGGGDHDDLAVSDAHQWVGPSLVIEEKLDGANVALWVTPDDRMAVAGRGGVGAMDRGRQLGRLRAWAAERADSLRGLLCPGEILYGEWLWMRHTVFYDALPDWFVVLDLWSPSCGFADHAARDRRVGAIGLASVPVLFRGSIPNVDFLTHLAGFSRFGHERMEGLVLRREAGGRLVDRAKWLRPDFVRRSDEAWREAPRNNALADAG